ncbi:MAG: hypothetical protein U0V02_07885 [Anaerolineales bacterium]
MNHYKILPTLWLTLLLVSFLISIIILGQISHGKLEPATIWLWFVTQFTSTLVFC